MPSPTFIHTTTLIRVSVKLRAQKNFQRRADDKRLGITFTLKTLSPEPPTQQAKSNAYAPQTQSTLPQPHLKKTKPISLFNHTLLQIPNQPNHTCTTSGRRITQCRHLRRNRASPQRRRDHLRPTACVLQFGRMCVGEFVGDDGNREDKRKIRQMYLVLVMVAIGWFRWDLFVVCSSDSATSNLPCLIWDLLLLLFYNED